MLLDPRNGPAFDLPAPVGPSRTYVIASTPRTGSTLFARALWDTGLVGAPKEYLNPMQLRDWEARLAPTATRRLRHRLLRGPAVALAGKVRFDDRRLAEHLQRVRVRRTGPTGWFGLKLHQHHARQWFLERDLDAWLRPTLWVRIRRQDRLAQALSLVRAQWTGQWAAQDSGWLPPRYSRRRIRAALHTINEQEDRWNQFFQHQPKPLELSYEQLVSDRTEAVRRTLWALGVHVPVSLKPPTMRVQADELTEEWRQRYLEGR